MKRKCLAKRLYEIATPYVQLIGWLVVMGTLTTAGIALVQQVEAFDGRVSALEQAFIESDKRLAVMDGKLDVLIERR